MFKKLFIIIIFLFPVFLHAKSTLVPISLETDVHIRLAQENSYVWNEIIYSEIPRSLPADNINKVVLKWSMILFVVTLILVVILLLINKRHGFKESRFVEK